ncbi:hypothetical protein HPB52_017523 [Rhipicephalus sanguineus]|uniref:Uncharacterized protein n=1 Tax=Rhipicephalus sanguineus TaxID=34632 RepID=A0A9D4SPG6_RHISA|nr:hypothetical protein HPB52_017523 [Rhipicephalus sanguineus]
MKADTCPSRIFQGYRALGYVCNHVPFVLRYINRRKEHLVITSIGRCFHTYGGTKLDLLTASQAHDDEISCIAGDSRLVYTASGKTIYSWLRGSEVTHEHLYEQRMTYTHSIHLHHISAMSSDKAYLFPCPELYLELSLDSSTFRASTLLHPVTYVNKILVGSEQGPLQLWNIRTGTLVHTFSGWQSAVTALEQSPAVDVVAIGLASGETILHNLKFDETLMRFQQDWGPVTAVSFRTDGHSHMATGSPVGHVAVWDLEKRALHSQLLEAHRSAVTGMRFLPDEPLLLTSSPDNSLRMWIFDQSDGSGRLLKQQQGHSSAPCRIRFHGAAGTNILSAGLDSTLRSFSTLGENLNKSLGQASYDRKKAKKYGVLKDPGKMPPICEFTTETTREKEWDSVAACHRGVKRVTTWSYDRCCMGKHQLLHDRFKGVRGVSALCVSLSACGNFVTIGYSSGHVDRFNIQSGIHRMAYGKELAHEGSVRGVASDALNQVVVTAGADSHLRFWAFRDGRQLSQVALSAPVARICLHRESGMLAVASDDFSVCVVDVELRRVVRAFASYYSQITDMASPLQHLFRGEPIEDNDELMEMGAYKSPDQLAPDMVTLSKLPYSRWQNLLNIEVVKKRNKPKEPPSAPKAAPFFLPTTAGLDPQFVKLDDKENMAPSKITSFEHFQLSAFAKLLNSCAESNNYDPVFERLKELGPSSVDFEIRGLSPEAGGSSEALLNFLKAMGSGLKTRRDFELVQSYLGLFLKVHADMMASEDAFREELVSIADTQHNSWKELEVAFNQSLCIVNYLRSAIL